MASGLEWRLPRAQSARPCGPATSPVAPPLPELRPTDRPGSTPTPPRCPSAPPSSAFRPSPPSPAQRCASAAPPRLPATAAAAAPKKYWELGGLGPVMNEDWEVRRERRMRQKAFGKAANAANCRAHAAIALAATSPPPKPNSGGEHTAQQAQIRPAADPDPEEAELATRAARRDVAAALALS